MPWEFSYYKTKSGKTTLLSSNSSISSENKTTKKTKETNLNVCVRIHKPNI